jgi:Mce-associated membrane protein
LTRFVNVAHSGRVVVALAVVLASLGVLAVVLTVQLSGARSRETRRAEILRAAREHAANVTSYHYASIDADTSRVLAGAAGGFKVSYQAGAARLKTVVVQNRSVAEGTVLEAGIVSAARNSARVLVVGDTSVTDVSHGQPRVRPFGMRLDLVREDGRWLASDLRFVG